ncbi:MAG: ABC transporter ATP-binding protein [Gammaproteobacteria bacterium]|jgi:iron(III) transport system ATP-binding protein|nr:ABC transporter ATP-binding protein [Gammaproteobacteria bacterium]
MNQLETRQLSVAFEGVAAVRDVNLCVRSGSIGSIIGPSGCGKTTLLRAIAGFIQPASGEILFHGECVSSPAFMRPPEQRKIGYVMQDLALFPHLSVSQNIGFGLQALPRSQRRLRVQELLQLIGLSHKGQAYPHELSGGQQQRVAIARSMAPRPGLLLLDEPFSDLDPQLRQELPRELRRIFREGGVTVLLVTHDQHEAFAMCDEIGVMHHGQLLQWDTAYNIYHQPVSQQVADFVGEGRLLSGHVVDERHVVCALGRLCSATSLPQTSGADVDVLFRPDDIVIDESSELRATVVERTFRGSHYLYRLAINDQQQLLCLAPSHQVHEPQQQVGIRAVPEHVVTFPVT